jgi:hypothetical protein
MIVAIDITTAPSGEVTTDTLGLIATLYRPGSPARRLVLLGREEHRRALRHATHGLATVLTLDPPEPGRQQMAQYRQRKLGVMHDHDVDLLHVAGGGPLDLLKVGGPVVLDVNRLGGGVTSAALSSAERWHSETWWTAAAYRADAVIVPAESVRDDLCRQLGVEGCKVFVSPEPRSALSALTAAYAYATRAHPNRKAA